MNPHEEGEHFRRRDGRVTEHMARAQQLGAYRGWIEVAGRRREVSEANWLGQRDHSWGIRAEMRTDETNPPLTYYPAFFYCWTTAQFKDRGLHVFFKERAPGDKIYISGEEVRTLGAGSKESVRLDDVSHDIAWAKDPLGQTLKSAEFEAHFSDGSTRKLKIRALPGRYFLKGGLYGGLNGWSHGDDKGKLYAEHEVWTLDGSRDPQARAHAKRSCDRSDGRRRSRLRHRRIWGRQGLRPLRGSAGSSADLNGIREVMTYATLKLERRGAVEILSLNRPEALNALSPEMAGEITDYFEALKARLDVRVVMLRGEGRLFCAGADLGTDAFAEPGSGRAAAPDGDAKSSIPVSCAPCGLVRSRSSR